MNLMIHRNPLKLVMVEMVVALALEGRTDKTLAMQKRLNLVGLVVPLEILDLMEVEGRQAVYKEVPPPLAAAAEAAEAAALEHQAVAAVRGMLLLGSVEQAVLVPPE